MDKNCRGCISRNKSNQACHKDSRQLLAEPRIISKIRSGNLNTQRSGEKSLEEVRQESGFPFIKRTLAARASAQTAALLFFSVIKGILHTGSISGDLVMVSKLFIPGLIHNTALNT